MLYPYFKRKRENIMKKPFLPLFLLCFMMVSCGTKEPSSVTSPITTSEVSEKETILVEKSFSSEDDSLEFFQSGWMTGNSKFGTNSIRLIEDETCASGSGMVRTPTFEPVNQGEVTLIFQPTGFNNIDNREVFIDQTFSFAVDFLLKENDEYMVKETKTYAHKITKEDAELGYFSDLKPYATSQENANKMTFTLDNQDFNCVRVRYLSKPYYASGKQGMNLEIFYLQVKTKIA